MHLLFSVIVASGGHWSTLSGGGMDFYFGLTHVELTGATCKLTHVSDATEECSMVMKYGDFFKFFSGVDKSKVDQIEGSGYAASAFLAMSCVFGVAMWIVVERYIAGTWPRITRFTLVFIIIFAGFTVIPWTVWNGFGHKALKDLFANLPELGWCLYVHAAVAFPMSVVAAISAFVLWMKGPDDGFSITSPSGRDVLIHPAEDAKPLTTSRRVNPSDYAAV